MQARDKDPSAVSPPPSEREAMGLGLVIGWLLVATQV